MADKSEKFSGSGITPKTTPPQESDSFRKPGVPDRTLQTSGEIEQLTEKISAINKELIESFAILESRVKQKAREVRYLKEYNETILLSVPDPIFIFDDQLRIEYFNAAAEALLQTRRDLVIGRTIGESELKYKEIWASLEKRLVHFFRKGEAGPGEEAAGKDVPGNDLRDPLAPKEETPFSQLKTLLALGDRYFVYRFFEVATEEADRRAGLLMKEITKEKHLQDQLGMAEKLAGLGRLSAGIAHEINNPLFSILGFTEAIADEKDSAKIKTYAEKVLNSARHISSIVQKLTGSVSEGKAAYPPININECVEKALDTALQATGFREVALEKYFTELPPVKAEKEELQQAFINIITNALQALEGKGRLTLSTLHKERRILVTIRDNGPGIPQGYQSNVFDPFFTTKRQGSGSGLGLTIAHRTVQKYGGRIELHSTPGEGTVFTIDLPVDSQR